MKELTPHQLMKWDMHELVVDEIDEGHLHLEDLSKEELEELLNEDYLSEEEYNECIKAK
jgi:hypothetical protein